MSLLGPLELTVATGALLALPLAPALRELRLRRDASALPIQQHDGHIANFARAFRSYLAPALPRLRACGARGQVEKFMLPDGTAAVLVGDGGPHRLTPGLHGGCVDRLVLSASRLVLGDGMTFLHDLYAADTLFGGHANVYRALLGEKEVFLGEGSRVLRWVHAEHALYVAGGSVLRGRASAGQALYLWPGCEFERVHAPRISILSEGQEITPGRTPDYGAEPSIDGVRGRWRLAGNFCLRAGELVQGNIVAEGEVRIDECCRIRGGVKSHGNTHVASCSQVDGSIVSSRRVRIDGECLVCGPILAEDEVFIGPGTQVGSPELPTTVSAPRIRIAPGSTVYGTMWAREGGRVEV